MNKVSLAIEVATKAHQDILDKNGEYYILHPLSVGLMGATDDERIVGFLHDVMEDTDWSAPDLIAAGIPAGIVKTLEILTHIKPWKDENPTAEERMADYLTYIRRIVDSGNPLALRVKYNDLRDNISRPNSNEWFQKKYGAALALVESALKERMQVSLYKKTDGKSCALFACGCFWGVQHMFAQLHGVERSFAGYTGGEETYPSYESVRQHASSHIEAVAVEYDSDKIDYKALCRFFFEIHDPAQTDGQGPDIGPQYRSAIFYNNQQELAIAEEVIAELRSCRYEVNTLLQPAGDFWIAEGLHQNYYDNTGGEPYCHIRVKKF